MRADPIGRKAGEGQSSAQRLPEAKEVETTGAGGLGARAEREGWGGSWWGEIGRAHV